ncbi:MAG: tetratricopeptide repeat protein [Gaiellaceae bacterium]
MTDRLRSLWDFDDLDASERRFRGLLATEADDGARAEVLTQLARIEGLRGDFAAGERLLSEAALLEASGAASARIDLEHGRLHRSSGDDAAALPFLESAFETASQEGEGFLAADAAHMAALAAPGRDGFVEWTERGIALAESNEDARYWLGPLLNNLGWEHYEAGELDEALRAFERALTERERDPADAQAIAIARYAVAKTLRVLGRAPEALTHIEQATASADDDGWFQEELAETYSALGRANEAAAHADRALTLLPVADSAFERDKERKSRLQELANASRDRARPT